MDFHQFYMNVAITVREKANCRGRKVGAVLAKQNRIISTGYNGTPEGMRNCLDGGCVRCCNREMFKAGDGYHLCICVHAEQNALISAARFGVAVEDSVIYSTMSPCFDCAKLALQAKVKAVYYVEKWQPSPSLPMLIDQYDLILRQFPDGVYQLALPAAADPNDRLVA